MIDMTETEIKTAFVLETAEVDGGFWVTIQTTNATDRTIIKTERKAFNNSDQDKAELLRMFATLIGCINPKE